MIFFLGESIRVPRLSIADNSNLFTRNLATKLTQSKEKKSNRYVLNFIKGFLILNFYEV